MTKYGPEWYAPVLLSEKPTTYEVRTSEEFAIAVSQANSGDIIELSANRYELSEPLKINKKLIILSADSSNKSTVLYLGEVGTPAFEMNPKGELELNDIILIGNGKNYAFASLEENMSSLYNLNVQNSEISNFDYLLKAYKHSFSEFIRIESTAIKNCDNGLELSSEDDNRGEYNAENICIVNCQFEEVDQNVIDYYRGGYDESTVGGNLVIEGSTFTNCGGKEKNKILINTYGIINVDISDNTFTNNKVQLIARLWGVKNNSATNNTIKNSGRIITEQNLPLKLMY